MERIFSKEAFFRAGCDLVIINICLFVSFFISRSLNVFETNRLYSVTVGDFFNNIPFTAGMFVATSAVCLSVFALSGFYTRSRFYQSRYKALVIFQAVTLSFLILGFASFLFQSYLAVPPRLLLVGGCLTLIAVLASRLWAVAWRRVVPASDMQVKAKSTSDGKRVLVIGGAGYIGSALLPKLLNDGYQVRLLDLFVYGEEPIAEVVTHKNLKIIRADFRQIDEVIKAVNGVDSVIHLGAIVGDPACALDEDLTVEVNLMATKMIADVCKAYNVEKFVFASTCSVYGASDDLLDERSNLNPVSLYARTKIACERILRGMADDKFSPVFLRFSTIFGLSGRTRFDLVVNLLTAKAVFDKEITLFGGDQWRPFLHVDDAALSVVLALKAPREIVHNQVFNVGSSDQNYTLAQAAELIHRLAPDSTVTDYGQDGDRRNYRVEFSKIRNILGFKSKWSLEAGIQQVLDAIARGDISNYTDMQFNNAKFLSEMRESKIISRHMQQVLDIVEEV